MGASVTQLGITAEVVSYDHPLLVVWATPTELFNRKHERTGSGSERFERVPKQRDRITPAPFGRFGHRKATITRDAVGIDATNHNVDITRDSSTGYSASDTTVARRLNTVGAKSVANATAIVNLGDVTEMDKSNTPYTSADTTIVDALRTAGVTVGPFSEKITNNAALPTAISSESSLSGALNPKKSNFANNPSLRKSKIANPR